jgi:type II secretory pathway component PulF
VQALPMATRRLLIAAERSGDLETVFSTLAADMAAEVERRSERLLAVMEPALIVTMFLIIGSLLMSIMLPMLTLSSRVGT